MDGETMFMNPEWVKLEPDELAFEERQLVDHICAVGLKETRQLLAQRTHEAGREQTRGAILAFEFIEDAGFTTCSEFIGQWQTLEKRVEQIRANEERIGYWKTRGQQLQLEFILERILAYRVLTGQIDARHFARAGLYVVRWMGARAGRQ